MWPYSFAGAALGLAVASLLLLSRYLARRRFMAQHGCQPPKSHYPLTWRDLYTGIKFQSDNFEASKGDGYLSHTGRSFQRLGNTYAVRVFLHRMIVTTEPENLKAVYATNFQDFGLGDFRTETFKPLIGNGIFSSDGHQWKHSRDLLRPAFAKVQIADLDIYERHIQQFVKLLPKDGVTEVDLQPLFFRLTLDSATEIILGKSINSLGDLNGSTDRFTDAYEVAKWEVFKNLQLYPLGQWRNMKDMNAAISVVHEYVDGYVNRAFELRKSPDDTTTEEETKKAYSFLKELAQDSDDRDKVRGELLSVLLAGRDTTAALLSNVFFVLRSRPDVWARIRAEVDELDGEKPTFRQVKDMRYIQWVLNESLRLHPVVPVNTRTALRDTTLPLGGGPAGTAPLHVPKGTQVVTNFYVLHRREDIYGADAAVFKPERWETLRPRWGHLPFSGGPRICPGQGLALTEAAYTIVRFVQMFDEIRGVGKEVEWRESLAITCCNLHGAKVVLTPRKL